MSQPVCRGECNAVPSASEKPSAVPLTAVSMTSRPPPNPRPGYKDRDFLRTR